MSCIWNHTGMDSPLWTCLFLCLVALLLQPAEAQECPEEIKGVKEMMEYVSAFNAQLEKDHIEPSEMMKRLKTIEDCWLKANLSGEKIPFSEHSSVQVLAFKIEPSNFPGLNISSNSMDGKNSSLLNNYILGATLGTASGAISVTKLTQPVEVRFWHDADVNSTKMTCVFWEDKTGSALGSWSSQGCKTIREKDMVRCQCNHLTYFAVLLQISSDAIDEALLAPLTYISMVGCSISAAASLLTILLHLCSRKKRSNYTTKIHMNLLGVLFLLNISFLLSEPLVSTYSWLCRGTAAFLHYSLLCCLTWMAIEGFHLYLLLIKVYNVYIRRYITKLCAIGWGLPALAVLIILLVKKEIYGPLTIKTDTNYHNATMCWVTDRHVHYINLGYAAVTILFNMVILVIVMRMMRALRSNMDSRRDQVKKDLVTVLGLTCLLGTTWALAFLSFGAFLIPQLFLFTIINSLQGFFICLWYCTMHRQPEDTSSSGRSSQMTK